MFKVETVWVEKCTWRLYLYVLGCLSKAVLQQYASSVFTLNVAFFNVDFNEYAQQCVAVLHFVSVGPLRTRNMPLSAGMISVNRL